MKFILSLVAITILISCNQKKEISTATYLSFIGSQPGFVKTTLLGNGWKLLSEEVQNVDYPYTYTYCKENPLNNYVAVDQCDKENSVCRLVYGIDSSRYLTIPNELIKSGYELLSEDDKENAHNIVYVKSKTYDVSANLVKSRKDTSYKYRYCMIITKLDLPK